MRVLGVYREDVYSPGKVTQDASILDSALKELSGRGVQCSALHAEGMTDDLPPVDLVLSMAQSESALQLEEQWEERGLEILNPPRSVRNCYRKPLIERLSSAGMPLPRSRIVTLEELRRQAAAITGGSSCWVKRGDVHAVASGDVERIRSGEDLERALEHFTKNDIREILLQEHVEGRTVKFYGVGQEYFRAFLSTTGEEVTRQVTGLKKLAVDCAGVLGLEIYGGDTVIAETGEMAVVDLNDWPSFSPCCSSAAEAIARQALNLLSLKNDRHRASPNPPALPLKRGK